MRVLLDENVPRKLKWRLRECEALTVSEQGWQGIKNGALLQKTAQVFDILITMDQSLQYQQNISSIDLGLIVLVAPSNDYDDLFPLVPQINQAIKQVHAGMVRVVSS